MNKITVYLEFWEYLRSYGSKTIMLIDSGNAWDLKVKQTEFTIKQTFDHIIQSIFEDAGTWFLKDLKKFISTDSPKNDLNKSINRMIEAIKDFNNEDLEKNLTFQWGEETTIKDAIKQNIFHAVSHFGQLKERVGFLRRNKKSFNLKSNTSL
jgi:hypothetical protein